MTEWTAPPAVDQPPRVLLVDDHIGLLAQLTELLTESGIDLVGTATDGHQVLSAITAAIAGHGWVDVVVMDARMPTVNGLAATRQVKAVFPAIEVVLHTAFADQLGTEPQDVGVFAQIAKGSHPNHLLNAIHQACASARRHRRDGRANAVAEVRRVMAAYPPGEAGADPGGPRPRVGSHHGPHPQTPASRMGAAT